MLCSAVVRSLLTAAARRQLAAAAPCRCYADESSSSSSSDSDSSDADAAAERAAAALATSVDQRSRIKRDLLSKLSSTARASVDRSKLSGELFSTLDTMRHAAPSAGHLSDDERAEQFDRFAKSAAQYLTDAGAASDGVVGKWSRTVSVRLAFGDRKKLPVGDIFDPDATGTLGVFAKEDRRAAAPLPIWSDLQAERIEAMRGARGPSNAWEEHIQWTREGKLWPYPIDNECGLHGDDESTVPFHEHVFINRQLDHMGFASEGPVREFMEVACLGLSKNPHLTLAEKKDTLQWFKDYMSDEKLQLIEQIRAADK